MSSLCVTLGALALRADGWFANDGAKLRAVAPGGGERSAALEFVLHGEPATLEPLASGELRRQLGLKLRAADGCNLVTVMWRVAETGPLVVALKRNSGVHTSRECGARGTRRIPPRRARELLPPHTGEAHELAAELSGSRLRVRVDGELAWEGALPDAARDLGGAAGLRSDNVRFSGRLALDPSPAANARCR